MRALQWHGFENRIDWGALDFDPSDVKIALMAGGKVIIDRSAELVPKRTGDLASTRFVSSTRGGLNTIGYGYRSVYARYIHEHVGFKHPFGGSAKFLELAMLETHADVRQAIGERLMELVKAKAAVSS